MSTRFYTSDLHLGHERLALLRGFASTEEHDSEIARRWNNVVSPSDTVFVAGDIALGRIRNAIDILMSMNGTKHLISGNHDNCWPGHDGAWKHIHFYTTAFSTIHPFLRLRIDGRLVLISHFPYEADRHDQPRFTQYRLRNEGNWLLHGHTHSELRQTSPREIHIGMDAWNLTPVAEQRIITVMRRQILQEGHSNESAPLPRTGTHVLPENSQAAATAATAAAATARIREASARHRGGEPGASGAPGNPAGD